MESKMNFRTMTVLAAAVASSILVSGCETPGVGGSDYTYTQVRGEQSVRLGTVENVRKVKISSNEPGLLGAIAGGVGGAALGSTIGGGNGNAAATVLGALAGGAAGDAIQGNVSTQDGVELTIRLDSGYVIAVTQGADEKFRVGDRVQVLGGGGATRVTKLDSGSGLNYARPAAPPPQGAGNSAPPPPPPGVNGGAPVPPGNIRYYCPDSNSYYPAVPSCPSPWMKVVH